ncbi:MAG: hypothetical protein ACTSUQ_08605 [Candidatus Freyarchaeota archaeon]
MRRRVVVPLHKKELPGGTVKVKKEKFWKIAWKFRFECG